MEECYEVNESRRKTSVKPGRGPSFMNGIGGVFAALFGLFWFFAARSITSDIGIGPARFFPYFGLLFVAMAVAEAIYNFKNATAENRHSLIDLVDSEDEPDPLDPQSRIEYSSAEHTHDKSEESVHYCPYCGRAVDEQFKFCPGCGKEL